MAQNQAKATVNGQENAISEKPSKGAKTKMDAQKVFFEKGVAWKEFFWNPATKEFLGRNAMSWSKIIIFYIVFYLFLAGFFSFMMIVFYNTIDYNRPKYTSYQGESILKSPGLSVRPDLPETIKYNQPNDSVSFAEQTASIHKLLKRYVDTKRSNAGRYRNCDEESISEKQSSNEVCDFSVSTLFDLGISNDTWGFNTTSSSSVILKLNKVFDWVPEVYEKTSPKLPLELREYINGTMNKDNNTSSKMVWLWCKTKVDGVNFTYSPQPGFPSYYYPFRNQKGYLAPLVAVSVNGLPATKQDVKVVCSTYAKNIKDTSIAFTFNISE